jgi:branched-chain amino acid transport system substrate-binding protein
VGVLTSITGSAASGFTDVEAGVKARFALQNAQGGVNGHQLKYVMADDTSTPAGAVSATTKLILQDKVFGILQVSPFFATAAKVTKQHDVPVAGGDLDGGPEWLDRSYTNLFDSQGYQDFSLVSTTVGQYFKMQGGTSVASIGYGVSPSSHASAKAALVSAKQAGLKDAYLNNSLTFGTTDVGPVVLAIKNSGADSLYLSLVASTAFAIVQGLRQAGVNMKVTISAAGYGGPLLADKAATQAAEGMSFSLQPAPIEANTDGTNKFKDALSQYANSTALPGYGAYVGWLNADLFIRGLELSGADPTQASFIKNLNASTWDGAGLQKPTDYANRPPVAGTNGPGNCNYFAKLVGGQFQTVPDAEPLCGTIIEGVKVS